MKTLGDIYHGDGEILYSRDVYPMGTDACPVASVCCNSGKATANSVFVCLRGAKADGHAFAPAAYKGGARIFVCEQRLDLPPDAIQIITGDTRSALADFSAEFYSHPEKELKIIGITGTKGKSTVAYMLAHILEQNGKKTGVIGTCGISAGGVTTPSPNTTPESVELYSALRRMADIGCEFAVMEVSSQAILMRRIRGIRFFAAAMTNLSPDHMGEGEHPDFDNYKACKKALFSLCDNAVFNADDKYFDEFSSAAKCPAVCYSVSGPADYSAVGIHPSDSSLGVDFKLVQSGKKLGVNVGFPGIFSVGNALCAIALADISGISPSLSAPALASVKVPGRFEQVQTEMENVTFIIDYAHNGESLRLALDALRKTAPKRLVCLFGSVGCRTEMRRKELGTAARAADLCILTSDNPDTEPPEKIIGDIAPSLGETPYVSIPDRELAIKYAVENSLPGDLVLFAGKGHETYQLINGKKLPFCERDLIKKYAKEFIRV